MPDGCPSGRAVRAGGHRSAPVHMLEHGGDRSAYIWVALRTRSDHRRGVPGAERNRLSARSGAAPPFAEGERGRPCTVTGVSGDHALPDRVRRVGAGRLVRVDGLTAGPGPPLENGVTKTSNPSDATTCVWCGYNTDAAGATQCAECGGSFEDRERIERIGDRAVVLLGFSIIGLIPASIGLGALAFENATGYSAFAVVLAGLTIGFMRAVAAFRQLKEHGRKHSSRRHAAIAALISFCRRSLSIGSSSCCSAYPCCNPTARPGNPCTNHRHPSPTQEHAHSAGTTRKQWAWSSVRSAEGICGRLHAPTASDAATTLGSPTLKTAQNAAGNCPSALSMRRPFDGRGGTSFAASAGCSSPGSAPA